MEKRGAIGARQLDLRAIRHVDEAARLGQRGVVGFQ
jgi:hypothetical protein